MTELLITPNFDKKTAKAKGAVAAGEHISVTIENASDIDTASLRLRVISLSGKTLAMFQPTLEPDEDGQTYAWGFVDNGGISCELNLNTVQMQESVCGMCEADFELVLDDPKAHTLYFKGPLSVQGWPKKEGAEAPYDLDGFPALIDDWTKQLDSMELSAKRVEDGVEIMAWDGKGKKPNPVKVKDGAAGGGGGGGTTNYNQLYNKPKINGVELSGNKTAADLGLSTVRGDDREGGFGPKVALQAVNSYHADSAGYADYAMETELARGAEQAYALVDENSEPVPSATVLVQLNARRDNTDNIAVEDDYDFGEWKFHCDVPEIQAALDANPPIVNIELAPNGLWGYAFWNLPAVEGWEIDVSWGYSAHSTPDESTISSGDYLYHKSYTDGAVVTATRTKTTVTKSNEPYVTPTGVKALAIPKYDFATAVIVDGVLTVAPYTNARLFSDGTAFEVAVGGESGYMRDCVLRVECGETAPTITWGANFHPRTDAETDFACVAGKRNVYWITEHAPNEFTVAGWQETEGGNAS